MAEYSELLTKLMDEVITKKDKARIGGFRGLSPEELVIFQEFLSAQSSGMVAELDKLIKK